MNDDLAAALLSVLNKMVALSSTAMDATPEVVKSFLFLARLSNFFGLLFFGVLFVILSIAMYQMTIEKPTSATWKDIKERYDSDTLTFSWFIVLVVWGIVGAFLMGFMLSTVKLWFFPEVWIVETLLSSMRN